MRIGEREGMISIHTDSVQQEALQQKAQKRTGRTSFQLNGNSSSTPSGILINPPSSTAACWLPCLASASALLSPKPKELASISV